MYCFNSKVARLPLSCENSCTSRVRLTAQCRRVTAFNYSSAEFHSFANIWQCNPKCNIFVGKARFACARFFASSMRLNFKDEENFTVSDVLRKWREAKEAGMTPTESQSSTETIYIMFVGNDNSTVSVAAEAIFADMVRRRSPLRTQIRSQSAGIDSGAQGSSPDPMFVEGLRFKRKLDVSSYTGKMLLLSDISSYDIVVCNGRSASNWNLHLGDFS